MSKYKLRNLQPNWHSNYAADMFFSFIWVLLHIKILSQFCHFFVIDQFFVAAINFKLPKLTIIKEDKFVLFAGKELVFFEHS